MSKIGCEVIIKYVLQVIPTYAMSIENGGSTQQSIRWMFWDKLSSHERRGFKDLASFIVVMLGSLVERLFNTQYFPHIVFFGFKIGTNPSYVWRSIFSAKNVFQQRARWCV